VSSLLSAALERWRALDPLVRFVPVFIVYQVLITIFGERMVRGYPVFDKVLAESTAYVEFLVMGLFTSEIAQSGRLVTFESFPVMIVGECIGLLEFMIYTAAVFAFPATWRERLIGLVCGLPLLYLFNVVRIGVLLVVGSRDAELFEFFHIYFWQTTLVLLVGGVWLLWVALVVQREEGSLVRR
jgi:exosortase H (IPTLxxWG-CTERM-specific)